MDLNVCHEGGYQMPPVSPSRPGARVVRSRREPIENESLVVDYILPLRSWVAAGVESRRAARGAGRAHRAAAQLPPAMSDTGKLIEQLRTFLASSEAPDKCWADQRLGEAERSFKSAVVLRSSDPVEALAFTRMAADLAAHALRVAGSSDRLKSRHYPVSKPPKST